MTIIAPINVAALRVSPSTNEQAKAALYNFSSLGTNPSSALGNLIAANQFESAQVSLHTEPGIHLHWSLPRAYTHGTQNQQTGRVSFPVMPNRWLVIRFLKDSQQNVSVRAWVLESDKHRAQNFATPSTTLIPWMDEPTDVQGLQYNFIGNRVDLQNSWTEPGGGAGFLGASFQAPFGYGETFTAYYRNSGTVLGLYDDLADHYSPANKLEDNCHFSASYSVIGWVSASEADECNLVLNEALTQYQQLPDPKPEFATFVQKYVEQTLDWSLSDYSSLTQDTIGQCRAIVSGVLASLTWDITSPGNPYYPDALPAGTGVAVSVGNNTAEAVSAYLNALETAKADAADGDVTSNVEMLLNALQFGQLQKLSAGNIGVGQLEEFLHGTSFASQQGGYLWSVRRPMNPGEKPMPGTDNEAPLPLYLAKVLSGLNQAQKMLDGTRNDISTRQRQSFLDWTYHINSLNDNVIHGSGDLSDDLSGPFLADGLMRLYELLLRAGSYQQAALPVAPYDAVPDAFTIPAPFVPAATLRNYSFNAATNAPAGVFIQHALAYSTRLDQLGEEQLPTAQADLTLTLALLQRYEQGGFDAQLYVDQAAIALGRALGTLQAASQTLTNLQTVAAGLPAMQATVAQAQAVLDGYLSSTGVFATYLVYTSSQEVPLPASTTHSNSDASQNPAYTGAIAQTTLTYLNSWDAPGGGSSFPGMKAQMDIFAGQSGQPKNLFETQGAALYLGIAYFYYQSQQSLIHSSAYYLQMAQQELVDARGAAAAAAAGLQAGATVLAGTVLTSFADTLSQLVDTALPAIQAALAAPSPGGVQQAIQQLIDLLDASRTTSIPALSWVTQSADWQALRDALQVARQAVAQRLPAAQQVAQWNQFLYAQLATDYQLDAAPADSFFSPNDPVLLFAEQAATASLLKPVNRNGQAPKLPCRLDTELIGAVQAGSVPALLSGLAASLAPGIAGLSTTLQKLGLEGYLLAPEYAAVVSAANLETAAEQNFVSQYNNFHEITLNDPPAGLSGKLPYYIAYSWFTGQDGFLPLFIWWETDYQYAQAYQNNSETYPSDYLALFELGRYGIELQPTDVANFDRDANFFTTHGVISLSSTATVSLCTQIQTYCVTYLGYDPAQGKPQADEPNYEQELRFYNAYTDYKTLNVLSQGLSGFGAGLGQRAQELQIPLTIPESWTENNPLASFWPTTFLHAQTPAWPVEWNAEGLDLDALAQSESKTYFAPLRAGFLQIKKVVLVDVFGRFVTLDLPQAIVTAESMTASQAPADHPVYLPPRLVQPTRLNFNWLAAASASGIESFVELSHHPAASPICGWLFPNHLDGTLMLYDASGEPLGSLGLRSSVLHWFPVPGEGTSLTAANRDQMLAYFAARNTNAVFQQFLEQFLYADSTPAAQVRLEKFLTVLSLAQQFIITPAMQESDDLAVLIGRPLVLTQAVLSLEHKGQPAVGLDLETYPVWNKAGWQFELSNQAFIPYNLDNLNQGAIGQLTVPVKIGTAEIQAGSEAIPYFDDGLAGYFVADDYTTMFTPVDVAPSGSGIISTAYPAVSPVALRPNGPAVQLTMLLDPRAAVHATTGILPVGEVVIHGSQFAQIAGQLEVNFLTAPILTSAQPPLLPLPTESSFKWYWQQVGRDNQGPLKTDQQSTNAMFPNTPQQLIDGWLQLKKSLV